MAKKKTSRRYNPRPTEGLPSWTSLSQAYAKVGNFGEQGSGKTVTMILLIIGFARWLKQRHKAVYMFDTEGGAHFVGPLLKHYGLELRARGARAFTTLQATIRELMNSGEILLVDSITHPWKELMESYRKEKRKEFITLPDWGVLKPRWEEGWAAPYVSSNLHIFICGRLAFEYEMFKNPEGELESYRTGTKMKTETEFGYEPSLLYELELVHRQAVERGLKEIEKKQRVGQAAEMFAAREYVHRMTIRKDRSMSLMGRRFHFQQPDKGFPDFEKVWQALEPFFSSLSIGQEHKPLDTKTDSRSMFATDSRQNIEELQRKRQGAIERIKHLVLTYIWEQSNLAQVHRHNVIQRLFNTPVWEEVEAKASLEQLEAALDESAGSSPVALAAMDERDRFLLAKAAKR